MAETKSCELCSNQAIYHCDTCGYYFCKDHVKFHDSIQMLHLHAKMRGLAIEYLNKSKEYENLGSTIKENG